MNWYDDRHDLVALGEHLADTFELHSAEAVQRFYENPWKWRAEWEAFSKDQDAPSNDETGSHNTPSCSPLRL